MSQVQYATGVFTLRVRRPGAEWGILQTSKHDENIRGEGYHLVLEKLKSTRYGWQNNYEPYRYADFELSYTPGVYGADRVVICN
jgi:hypothetical protein